MINDKKIRNIQHLIMEIVEKAKSGHPGAAISLTPLFFVIYKHLRYDPDDPLWADRDILIMSNGHACLIQYIFLHLCTYLSFDDLVKYRIIGSKTPGHPENTTDGIEICTGPLGQGISNAVGFSFSQQKLKATIKDVRKDNDNNTSQCSLLKQITICIFGDGCYQEGISQESFSLACHYDSNVIFIYDNNGTTIDGKTELSMSDCPVKRFSALGFDVIEIDADDIETMDSVLGNRIAEYRNGCVNNVTMIVLKSKIASGTSLEGNEKSHGTALGRKVIDEFVSKNDIQEPALHILNETYEMFEKINESKRKERSNWNEELKRYIKDCNATNETIKNLQISKKCYFTADEKQIDIVFNNYTKENEKIATRSHLHNAMEEIYDLMSFSIVGSGDLTPSCLTKSKNAAKFTKQNRNGNYVHYGIREHAMFGIMNGIASHGHFLPIGSTFLNFITYGYHGVRLACLSKLHTIYIMTHDSIGLGEDGPTHQPIETLTLLRATPNLVVIRPCDGVETRFSLKHALVRKGPTIICLSRQKLPNQCNTSYKLSAFGGYNVFNNGSDITILATGSEVSIAIEVAKKLKNTSVISMLSCEIFDQQNDTYKKSILQGFVVSIEAGSTLCWHKYADYCIGVDSFGLSGDTNDVYDYFGLNVDVITEKIQKKYNDYNK